MEEIEKGLKLALIKIIFILGQFLFQCLTNNQGLDQPLPGHGDDAEKFQIESGVGQEVFGALFLGKQDEAGRDFF